MESKDYYNVMGVARDATEAQIKQAYRKLARKYHPDVSKEKDAEARFKEVGEAYEVLKSPEKRAAYDRLGKDYRPGEDFRPPPNWDSGFEFSGAGPGNSAYSDFFDALFGAQARSGGANRRGFHAEHGEESSCQGAARLGCLAERGIRRLYPVDARNRSGWQTRDQRTDLERASAKGNVRRSADPARRSVRPRNGSGNRAISSLRSIFSRSRCITSTAAT